MTTSERARKGILSKRGVMTGAETAKLYGVSVGTVYRVWKQPQDSQPAPNFRTALYSEIVNAMIRYEATGGEGLTKREDDLIDYIYYLEEYGDEAIDTLRSQFHEIPGHDTRPQIIEHMKKEGTFSSNQ